MTLRFENRTLRGAIALVAMMGWLLAFNHCAIAAFTPKPAQAAAEHSHCSGHPTPAKKSQSEDLPCCKTLSATVALTAKNPVSYDTLSFAAKDYQVGVILYSEIQQPVSFFDFDDTGPPGNSWFAESVLQRSLLAHAPPHLA